MYPDPKSYDNVSNVFYWIRFTGMAERQIRPTVFCVTAYCTAVCLSAAATATSAAAMESHLITPQAIAPSVSNTTRSRGGVSSLLADQFGFIFVITRLTWHRASRRRDETISRRRRLLAAAVTALDALSRLNRQVWLHYVDSWVNLHHFSSSSSSIKHEQIPPFYA